MKISIAMAVYKGEKHIEEQISSLFKQSHLPDEIIICDDSPDNLTGDIIQRISVNAPCPIMYSRNEQRLGIDKNFERSIMKTTGDIIFLCDQDDVWYEDKILIMVENFLSDPSVGGIFCNSEITDENLIPLNDNLWRVRGFNESSQNKFKKGMVLHVFVKKIPCSGHNIAFRAKLKDVLLPFPELPSTCHCYDSWIGMIIVLVSNWKAVSDILTKYRIHQFNASVPAKINFFERIIQARAAVQNNTFGWTANLINEVIKRIEQLKYDLTEKDKRMLLSRSDFLRKRESMSCNLIKRLPTILRLILNLSYFRFGSGLLNIAQDIFMRPWL